MLVNLNDLLPEASQADYAVPCFNILGYEDAKALIKAAESVGKPIILGANKALIEFFGVKDSAQFMRSLAEAATIPIAIHLDHTYDENIIYQAIHHGFSSVMFDGSQLPLEENIKRTKAVVNVAHAVGVTVEGEIGSVPYNEGNPHIRAIATSVSDASAFAEESGADAVAVSIGNIHRLKTPTAVIDHEQFHKIALAVKTPLVIHGTSGIKENDIRQLVVTRAAKFNIGTIIRCAFFNAFSASLNENKNINDRVDLMGNAMSAVEQVALKQLALFYPADFSQDCQYA